MNRMYKQFIASFKIQLKRRYIMLFKKELVRAGIQTRRGECLGCGECCKSSFLCPFLFEQGGRLLCRIHESKSEVCKTYPFSKDDVFPHTEGKCGYYFVDENDGEAEKTRQEGAQQEVTK